MKIEQAFDKVKKKHEDKVRDKERWKNLLKTYVPRNKICNQRWPEYDLAKTNEVIFVKRCLQELLTIYLSETNIPKLGRKGYSIKDKIFCMCIKVYYQCDLRKSTSVLKELKALNFIEKVPCYKSIDNFFNDKELNKILDDLILISSLPIASIEETGAIDATGLSMSRFDRWVEHKHGTGIKDKKKHFRKLHAIVGSKSNIFISAELTDQYVSDVAMFEPVIGDKMKYFKMNNFVADKAYSSRKVLSFLNSIGLNPYIPFRRGSTGVEKGNPIWSKMFDKFFNNHQEYMKIYHSRSNIESSFHMLKQRFGDNLMTKRFIANTNEIKAKILCHNICCLLTESIESSISIDFFDCVKKVATV